MDLIGCCPQIWTISKVRQQRKQQEGVSGSNWIFSVTFVSQNFQLNMRQWFLIATLSHFDCLQNDQLTSRASTCVHGSKLHIWHAEAGAATIGGQNVLSLMSWYKLVDENKDASTSRCCSSNQLNKLWMLYARLYEKIPNIRHALVPEYITRWYLIGNSGWETEHKQTG